MARLPPLFQAARSANAGKDALAGVTMAAMCLPQVLGYARIAGMPLVSGLYTALLAPLAFAALGSSRHLVVAADSATAAILSGSVSEMARPGSDAYLSMIAAVTLLTAAMLLLARVLRLGFLADFLSRTVLVGFLAGVGVQVGVAMTADMLGIVAPSHSALIQAWRIVEGLGAVNPYTLAISLLIVAAVEIGAKAAPRVPVAFVALICSVIAARLFDLEAHHVALLGPIQAGLPALRLAPLPWREVAALTPVAASCVVVILAQSAATSRAFGERYDEAVDENADILGLAAANALTALGGAFVANGSPTQTAVAERAGARSQFAQLVFAATVLIVLLTVVGLLKDLPRCALAAVIFTIAIGLIDLKTLRAMRRESPGEFKLALFTAAAVAGIGVEQGILLAVAASLLRHVRHSYRPHTAVLKRAPEGGWLEEPAKPGAQSAPGLILFRFNADLFYANAAHFERQVRRLVDGAPDPVRWLVIEAEGISNMDYSAARVATALFKRLRTQGVAIAFARVGPTLSADLARHDVIAAERCFQTRHTALTFIEREEGGG